MDSDNDNEGFQICRDTFDVIQSSKVIKQQSTLALSKPKSISLEPPISTYTLIDNYPTPSYLNHVYSAPLCSEQSLPSSYAWQAAYDCGLQKQFNEKMYEEVFKKFPQQRTNYKFYKQYGLDEYKTFTDTEPLPKQSKSCTLNIWDKNFLHSPNQDLNFCSNFECGNLEKVYKKIGCSFQYFLILSNDTNTVGFNQWFYFKVQNPNFQQINAKFIIVNNNKRTIPCIGQIGISYFSLDDYRFHGVGWQKCYNRVTCNVNNKTRRDNLTFNHTLSFQAKIKPNETVYFSLTLPYTFTKLKKFVEKRTGFTEIGITFSGNPIYLFKTGNPESQKSIVVIARQHPSQTSSSFVVEGLIEKLNKESPLVNFLKKKFNIVVIPMANPDGVIHGNSRTNLLGYDINRKWEQRPNKNASYQVFLIYHYLLKKLPSIQYLIDLHGHSKKLNSFAYFTTKRSLATLIAVQMAEKLPWFKIEDCQMAQTTPFNTLRWLGSNCLNIEKAITIETSIHGWSDQEKNIYPFTPQKLELIGSTLIEVLARMEIQKKANRKHIKIIQFAENHESSDSDPEGDCIKISELKQEKKVQDIQSSPSKKRINISPRKMRIKTVSTTFYKPTLSSTIRDRLKTEMTIQKVEIIPPNQNSSPNKLHTRKRTQQAVKYCRIRDSEKGSKRKLTTQYNGFNTSLTLKALNFSQKGGLGK